MIARVIEKVAKRGAVETAGKLAWNVSRIFSLAKSNGLCSENPADGVREDACAGHGGPYDAEADLGDAPENSAEGTTAVDGRTLVAIVTGHPLR